MRKIIKRMIHEKREYREQMARVEALPDDYKFVFNKIHEYMWRLSSANGSDMLNTQNELITLFEEGVLEGKHVLELTGKDVAAFCDDLLKDTKKWTDKYKSKLNDAIISNSKS